MGVMNQPFSAVIHRFPAMEPAIAELPVFATGAGEPFIESTDGAEQVGGKTEVVRGDESGLAGWGVVVATQIVHQGLAGL